MRIKRFNENISTTSIFDDENELRKYLGPISKYNLSIHYKCFKKLNYDYEYLPIGSQTKNGFSDINWLYQNREWINNNPNNKPFVSKKLLYNLFKDIIKSRKIIRGIIIDIVEPDLIEIVTSDEQRLGRSFSKIKPDFFQILNDIEGIILDLETENITSSLFLSSYPNDNITNFSNEAPISLLLLDGDI